MMDENCRFPPEPLQLPLLLLYNFTPPFLFLIFFLSLSLSCTPLLFRKLCLSLFPLHHSPVAIVCSERQALISVRPGCHIMSLCVGVHVGSCGLEGLCHCPVGEQERFKRTSYIFHGTLILNVHTRHREDTAACTFSSRVEKHPWFILALAQQCLRYCVRWCQVDIAVACPEMKVCCKTRSRCIIYVLGVSAFHVLLWSVDSKSISLAILDTRADGHRWL